MAARRTSDAGPAGRAELTGRPLVSAGSARSQLLTVLGELVMPNGNAVWTSSLLYVLTGLGIEEQTARQAIARGAAAGWIAGHRRGREVQWELTPDGRRLIDQGAERVYSMSAQAPAWDGNWLIVLVSIPQQQRAVRKKLYAALSWEGFGNPTPGVWLSPHPDRQAGVEQVISTLGLRECGWRKAESARTLGVARGYLHRLINQLEITQREDEGHNGNGVHGPNGSNGAVAREKFPAPKQIM